MENEKQKPLPIKILDSKNGYPFVQVPRFWVDSLMASKSIWKFPNGSSRNGARVPASFWKYSLVLWRGITAGNVQRETTLAMSQFPVRGDAAVRWTAAYSVSGLYDVEMGKYTANHDCPTKFAYRRDAEQIDWEIFITSLDLTLTRFKQAATSIKFRPDKFSQWSNTGGFKVMLALEVDACRARHGLPAVNEEFLAGVVSGKVLDPWRQPIGRVENEKLVPIFYPSVRRKRKEETVEEFEARLEYEAVEAAESNSWDSAWEPN